MKLKTMSRHSFLFTVALALTMTGAMAGDGYYLRAKLFDHYRVHCTAGGNETATLHDSALDDLLEAEGRTAELSASVASSGGLSQA